MNEENMYITIALKILNTFRNNFAQSRNSL